MGKIIERVRERERFARDNRYKRLAAEYQSRPGGITFTALAPDPPAPNWRDRLKRLTRFPIGGWP